MYEWLLPRIKQAKQVLKEYSVDWEFILNPPATEAEIIACEAELGTRIPYGYREFLLQWNGAYLFRLADGRLPEGPVLDYYYDEDTDFFLHGTRTIVEWHNTMLFDEEAQGSILIFANICKELCDCGFDVRPTSEVQDAVLECQAIYSLLEGFPDTKISNSFEEWLEKILNRIILEHKHPIYWSDEYWEPGEDGLNKIRESLENRKLSCQKDRERYQNFDVQEVSHGTQSIDTSSDYKVAFKTSTIFLHVSKPSKEK